MTAGPYRFLRHPAYAAELVMVGACCFAAPSWMGALLFAVAAAFIMLRIHAEEATLGSEDAYRSYAETSPWRLLPGVW